MHHLGHLVGGEGGQGGKIAAGPVEVGVEAEGQVLAGGGAHPVAQAGQAAEAGFQLKTDEGFAQGQAVGPGQGVRPLGRGATDQGGIVKALPVGHPGFAAQGLSVVALQPGPESVRAMAAVTAPRPVHRGQGAQGVVDMQAVRMRHRRRVGALVQQGLKGRGIGAAEPSGRALIGGVRLPGHGDGPALDVLAHRVRKGRIVVQAFGPRRQAPEAGRHLDARRPSPFEWDIVLLGPPQDPPGPIVLVVGGVPYRGHEEGIGGAEWRRRLGRRA